MPHAVSQTVCPLPPGHETGEARHYTRGCRCPESRNARRIYQNQRYRRLAYGQATIDSRVDASAARDRLLEWQEQGVNITRVAAALGYSDSTLDRIMHSPRRQALASTVAAVLAYQPTPADRASTTAVPAIGAIRRVRALTALGWSCPGIARHGEISQAGVDVIRAGKPAEVFAKTHEAICAIYDLIWDQAPPAETTAQRAAAARARNLAARNGWLPPMAWDDHGLDDPGYTPDPTLVMRPVTTRLVADVGELIDLLDEGVHLAEAARRAGYNQVGSAKRALLRAGRSTLDWDHLNPTA